ncbi:MAG: hypothetical protein JNL11_08355 [Bdellovibrionaceae bacterium]|nr:hypothetical protein [Pseudobdellovibrionaceae bacterium]
MLKRVVLPFFILLVVISGVAYSLAPSLIKRKIQIELYSRQKIEVNYDQLQIRSLDPLKISISNITIKKMNELQAQIKTVNIDMNLKSLLMSWDAKAIRFTMNIDDIQVNYRDTSPSAPVNNQTAAPIGKPIGDFKDYLKTSFGVHELDFSIQVGKFDYTVQIPAGTFRLYGNNTLIKIENLDQPLAFTLNSYLFSEKNLGPLSQLYIPVSVNTKISLKNGVANILPSELNIANIKNKFYGLVNLKNLDFDSTFQVAVDKIESVEFLKKYQTQFPFTESKGTLNMEAHARGNIHDLGQIQIKGIVGLKNFFSNLKYNTPDLKATGPIAIDVSSTFSYSNKIPAINTASWKISLDGSEIAYKDIFLKPKNVQLTSFGTISYLSDLTIEKFKLLFHTMDVSSKGMASLDRASDLSVTVKPFKLQDFKNFLPNNKGFDISGDVEIDAQVQGFLNQPRYLSVDVRKVNASNLNYFLKYKNDMISVEGPISFTFMGNLLVQRLQVLKGAITGQSDLTALVVTQEKQIRKGNTDPFKVNWSLRAHDGKLNIEKLAFNTFLSTFTLKGYPPLAKDDSFDLILEMENLNWKRAKTYLPANQWFDTISDMNNKGSVHVRGKLDPHNIAKTKWSVDSNIDTKISSLNLPFNFHLTNTPASEPIASPEPLKVPEAFISDPELIKSVRWNQKISIQNISFKDSAQFKNISLNVNLLKNSLKMDGEIASIFNGKMAFKDVMIPLTEKDPKIQFNLSSANLSFSPLIAFVMPEYKELLTGVANFEVTGSTKMPGTLNFKKDLVASGRFNIPTSEIQTLKIVDEVKQKFAAIKDIGVPAQAGVSNLSASTEALFEIQKSSIKMSNFKIIARNQDEILLNGIVQFDLNSKIEGMLRLVNLPAKGDFLTANQNAKGQVEIPILIEGNLKQPKWSFAGNTFEKMTQNFINYQKSKAQAAVDRKIAEAKQQAQTEVDKQKKNVEHAMEQKKKEIENEAIKKLDALFK